MVVYCYSGHVPEDHRSIRSLQSLGLSSKFYLDVVRHMENCLHADGVERRKSVQHVIFIIKNK